jgi:hypothetical protein
LRTPEATRHDARDLLAPACTPFPDAAALCRVDKRRKLRMRPGNSRAARLLLQIVGAMVFVIVGSWHCCASAKTVAANLKATRFHILLE